MRVLVAPGTLVTGTTVDLEEDEAHHLRVRRATAGEEVTAYDGVGGVGRGVLEARGKGVGVQLTAVRIVAPPPPLIMAVAAGDRDRFLRLAEQCTELGVTTLIPLLTERVASVESRIREPALEKARQRSRSACKQSGNPWATQVESLTPLHALAGRWPGCQWLLADPSGDPIAPHAIAGTCGWLIGPEGGFTPVEHAFAVAELQARLTWLSPHILRFETAAVSAMTLSVDRRGLSDREA